MSRRQPKGDVIYIIWCVLRNAHVCVFLHMSHVCVCKYVLVSLCVSVSLPMCLCSLCSGMVRTTSDMEWCVPPSIWYGVYHIGKLTLPLYLFQAKHTQTGFKTSLSFSRWARFFDSNVIKSRRLVCPISLDSSCHQGPQGHQKTTVNRPWSWEGPWMEKTQVTHPSKSSTWSFFTIVSLVTKSVQNRLLVFDGVSRVGTCGLVVQFVRL